MAKDKGKKKGNKEKDQQVMEPVAEDANAAAEDTGSGEKEPMSRKEFDKEMKKLQYELVKMQEWVKYTGAKICVIFEGRDTAGKGGVIRRIAERVSPRVFRWWL